MCTHQSINQRSSQSHTRAEEKPHPSTTTGGANPASQSDAGLGGYERVATALVCETCMCTHIYMCMYVAKSFDQAAGVLAVEGKVCIHIYLLIKLSVTHIRICIMCMCMYICMYVCLYIATSFDQPVFVLAVGGKVCIYMYLLIKLSITHIRICIMCMCIYICMYVCLYIATGIDQAAVVLAVGGKVYIQMYLLIKLSITHIRICIMCMCIYICMYVCLYIATSFDQAAFVLAVGGKVCIYIHLLIKLSITHIRICIMCMCIYIYVCMYVYI